MADPVVYTWTHTNEVTLPLVVTINHLDPLQRRQLAADKSCCCPGGCPPCTGYETCAEFGCAEDGDPDINGWFETYAEAWDAGNAANTWCGAGGSPYDCCPDGGLPCFVVGCDENSPQKEACKKYFWKLCCNCCDSCAEYLAPPDFAGDCVPCAEADTRDTCKEGGLPGGANFPVGTFPEGCCEPCADGDPRDSCDGHAEGTIPDSCFPEGGCDGDCGSGGACVIDKVGSGYCTASEAANGAPDGAVECDGENCDSGLGCYYITCDPTKCEDRFNWVVCVCKSV